MVVTSPIGDQDPPALAAIITMHAYFNLSVLSGTNFLNTASSTMAAARLSRSAEKKKAEKLIVHNNLRL